MVQTVPSHTGGDDKACLKTVQAIDKGMSLTGMLVSSSCETALGALCLQRAPGWSCSPGWNSRIEMGKYHLAVPQHCFPPQNKSSTAVKCCHPTNRITEEKNDAIMYPRLPWLTVRGALWSPGHHPVYHDPSIRVECLKDGSVPCSASLVPSTTGTITARWRSALFTAALLTISHWQKICTKYTALRNSQKEEDLLSCRLPLRAKKSHFLPREDLMLTSPSPGNCYVPGWVYLAAVLHSSLY